MDNIFNIKKLDLIPLFEEFCDNLGFNNFFYGYYYDDDNNHIAHGIKEGDIGAIKYAAQKMADLIPPNSVLIPMPSHKGYATDTLLLAKEIQKITKTPIADILKGKSRMSLYSAKKMGVPIDSTYLGFKKVGDIPSGYNPVLIDNVVDTGLTAKSALETIGGNTIVSFATRK